MLTATPEIRRELCLTLLGVSFNSPLNQTIVLRLDPIPVHIPVMYSGSPHPRLCAHVTVFIHCSPQARQSKRKLTRTSKPIHRQSTTATGSREDHPAQRYIWCLLPLPLVAVCVAGRTRFPVVNGEGWRHLRVLPSSPPMCLAHWRTLAERVREGCVFF